MAGRQVGRVRHARTYLPWLQNDGTRKYVPETLSNVSKAMKEDSQGQTNGSEYTSFGSFIAKLAPRVDSKAEMRGSKSVECGRSETRVL